MEQVVIKAADKLIFTNRFAANASMQKYPRTWNRKVSIIPHAFDQKSNSNAIKRKPKNVKMRFVYTGSLYGLRNPGNLILALKGLSERNRISVDIAGPVKGLGRYKNLAKNIGAGDIVSFHGNMAYKESLGLASKADVLLLIDAPSEQSLFLPSKLVDYLQFNKPIFGITPKNGATADLLYSLGYTVAAPEDPHEISAGIKKLIADWQLDSLKPSRKHHQIAKRYEIGRVAHEFAREIRFAAR
jgi:hypothetical protein